MGVVKTLKKMANCDDERNDVVSQIDHDFVKSKKFESRPFRAKTEWAFSGDLRHPEVSR